MSIFDEENLEEQSEEEVPAAEETAEEAPEEVNSEEESAEEENAEEEDSAEMPDLQSEFILTDEEGNEYLFTLLDFVDYEENLYAVLAPEGSDFDDEDAELEIVVMEVTMENESPSFNLVEDDALATAVMDAFVQKAIEEAEEE